MKFTGMKEMNWIKKQPDRSFFIIPNEHPPPFLRDRDGGKRAS